MKTTFSSSKLTLLKNCILAICLVGATTLPLALIGRDVLGEAVIALLYLVPVAWSATRWGLVPGLSAALVAALCFDFLFIPPFNTLVVGTLEGWLVLVIFLIVAVVVVERIQTSLTQARQSVYMYELCSALADQRTQDAVAHAAAHQIQQLFQATKVNLLYQPEGSTANVVVSKASGAEVAGRPDRVLPLLNSWGLVGEIQIWRGGLVELPPDDSPLLQNLAFQTAHALDRTRQIEAFGAAVPAGHLN